MGYYKQLILEKHDAKRRKGKQEEEARKTRTTFELKREGAARQKYRGWQYYRSAAIARKKNKER